MPLRGTDALSTFWSIRHQCIDVVDTWDYIMLNDRARPCYIFSPLVPQRNQWFVSGLCLPAIKGTFKMVRCSIHIYKHQFKISRGSAYSMLSAFLLRIHLFSLHFSPDKITYCTNHTPSISIWTWVKYWYGRLIMLMIYIWNFCVYSFIRTVVSEQLTRALFECHLFLQFSFRSGSGGHFVIEDWHVAFHHCHCGQDEAPPKENLIFQHSLPALWFIWVNHIAIIVMELMQLTDEMDKIDTQIHINTNFHIIWSSLQFPRHEIGVILCVA